MSTISELLAQIITAHYGRDVRQSIHDAIEQVYDDVSSPTLNQAGFYAAIQQAIQNGSLNELAITDGSVTTGKIAEGAIITGKIADRSVTGQKIALGTIEAENIKDGVITGDKLADGSIPVSKLGVNFIQDDHIADGAVTTRTIRNGNVTTVKIDALAVTEDKIADLSISTQKIISEAVDTDKIKNSSVTMQKLSPGLSKIIRDSENAVYDIQSDLVNINNANTELYNDVYNLRQEDTRINLSLGGKIDDAYVEGGYLYMTSNGEVVVGPLGPFSGGGGGGGGGGDVNKAHLEVENTTGWLSTTIADGADCNISFTWSSVEDEMPTGDGSLRITNNNIYKGSVEIHQGSITLNLAPYLVSGSNVVKIQIMDVYGNSRSINFSINSVSLSISSSFDASAIQSRAFLFPYTPIGAVSKTVYFILDGRELGTQTTSVSNRQMSFSIPAQSHGAHQLRVYFEAVINGTTVRSNELYYEFIYVDAFDNTVIITSNFSDTTQPQYANIAIPYQVYNPSSLTAEVKIYANDELVSTQTVDRTEQSYIYRANDYGELNIKIVSGTTQKVISITVEESDVDVEAETENLVLYLTSEGRSNNEEHPEIWKDEDNDISATLTGFNFSSDGWKADNDGITCLRVSGDARVEIPYKPFAVDFRSTGKTIELEFATRNVLDYDATILTCMSGGRGISLTPQRATLKSEQSEIGAQYKEDEHIRVTFVAEKRAENRLLLVYIDSIPSGVIQYPTDDDFSQTTPVNISIGSNDCTIDLYNIRVYDNDLTRHQVLDNWIADTQDATTMLERYTRNNVYDAYGKIVVANLPADLPYFILNAPELPQYKGDKKVISGSYVNKLLPSKSFTFENCQINVQGTSSAPYYRKNYDMQFKGGFELSSGHASNYELQTGNIPFNRFVLKADVASSEGANNVELVRLYNDICPYKTPEMKEDSRVRWGIDGFPIVVFWNNTDTGEVSFLGKYNFNLPKRASAPYGYANDDTMESWEFQNNTSDLMVFKTDYFDETMYTDPDTGETKELWRYDYEARFPNDSWTNYSKLQEFQSFVYSTYRANATGDALAEPVTYDGVTFTNDTADYRLAKFRAEFPTYAELNTFLFYYAYTELLLMVDSRAKNLFIGFNGSNVTESGRVATRKATAQPYDMDTGLGTNNEGSLVFGYSLEDTDHLSGGVNIFNGQDSVLWCNVRDAFPTEIRQMYQTLRSGGLLSYTNLENRYETHQAKWPEAVWIEDSWFKYIIPLISPDSGKNPTAVYLPMMQGSKEQQRKWWLSNRFKYMDSKWNAGDSLSQVIQLRGYAKADITVIPYTDIYPTVKYASYVVQERGQHGQPTTLVCPLSTVNDTEIYIYSAPQIESAGDLSGLKVGFADFSQAIRLQSIKIGDSSASYDNPNLYTLSLGNNALLKTLDVRNCSGLGDTSLEGHTQTTVDLSGCEIIEEVYFDGTKVQGVTLPNGGVLRVLHLPSTVTNLTIMNQNAITDLTVAGYSNISTLRLENVPTVDTKAILNAVSANTRVRLIGFYWIATGVTEIEALLDKLDTMRGLDEHGNNTEKAQVSGEIHTASLTGAEIAEFNARYPYVKVTADHTSAVLTYKTYNGASVLFTETVLDGGNGTKVNTTARIADAQYSYTPDGWATEANGNKDANALVNVVADRTVFAAYTKTLRTYTITWKNADNTTLETDTNVPYGSTPTYNGSTPTYQGQTSTGWSPAVAAVTGDQTYTAAYKPMYTATFVRASADGGGTLYTQNYVVEGSTPVYGGATPTTTKGDATTYPFDGWDPALGPIYANTTYTAKFKSPVEDIEITDSWEDIIANIDNGTYATKYNIGNYKPLDLGDEGTVNMQIVGFDVDQDSEGYPAPITFIAKELLNNSKRMNPGLVLDSHEEGTGGIGGWRKSEMRKYLQYSILPSIPSIVRNRMIPVRKYFSNVTRDTEYTLSKDDSDMDYLWIPGHKEISNDSTYETQGPSYSTVFTDDTSRKKAKVSTPTSYATYWLRSVSSANYFRIVYRNGNSSHDNASNACGVALGFSLGAEAETVPDSWDTIITNVDPESDYNIGDTKWLTLSSGERVLMQIVGFNVDELADDNGVARISWISKYLLNNNKAMNSTSDTANGVTGYAAKGWEGSEMRSYLNKTLMPMIPQNIRNGIQTVKKYSYAYVSGALTVDGQVTNDTLWIPSHKEIFNDSTYETQGPSYSTVLTDATSRKKANVSTPTTYSTYWLRSVARTSSFRGVSGNGSSNGNGANATCGVALGFCTGANYDTILDSWSDILKEVDAKTKYTIGGTKSINLGAEGVVQMQIVGFDTDELSDGTGTARISWISKQLLNTSKPMNSSGSTEGGWEDSELRAYLKSDIYPLLPDLVKDSIREVKKYSRSFVNGVKESDKETSDTLWIPSYKELFNQTSYYETQGPSYSTIFTDNDSRKKGKASAPTSYNDYWLRTSYDTSQVYVSRSSGDGRINANYERSIALGFCTGATLTSLTDTITDTWDEIFAAEDDGSYTTKYSIGDTKSIDLGTEGIIQMQIVGFNVDELADGSGTAKISWISKQILPTKKAMNSTSDTANGVTGVAAKGWKGSEMRLYLASKIAPMIQKKLRSHIKTVKKYSNAYVNGSLTVDGQVTNDTLWIPGYKEMFNVTWIESQGPSYSTVFVDLTARTKATVSTPTTYDSYWVRSVNTTSKFYIVASSGNGGASTASNACGVALGFCS